MLADLRSLTVGRALLSLHHTVHWPADRHWHCPVCGWRVPADVALPDGLTGQVHMSEGAMPQTVGCVGTAQLVRDMLRRDDCYEGGALAARVLHAKRARHWQGRAPTVRVAIYIFAVSARFHHDPQHARCFGGVLSCTSLCG